MLTTRSKKGDIAKFLRDLKNLLAEPDFNADTDFILIQKSKPNDETHSTTYTLLDLEYNVEDIIERLKELSIEEYVETRVDSQDADPPLLFIFGKTINRKLVYI